MPTNRKRKLFLGSGTAFGIIVFLAIIVAIQYIVIQHPKRWDLTESRSYTLAPQSKKVLGNFKQQNLPVNVIGFYESKETSQRDKAKDIFDQYKDAYSGFEYSFLDPDQNRVSAMQNKIDTYPTVLFKAGNKEERITAVSEESVTNALVKLLRTEEKKIYFLKGHGELDVNSVEAEGFSEAKNQIERQNYKTDELILLQTPQVPENASALIIAGPKTETMDTEIDSLRAYVRTWRQSLYDAQSFQNSQIG